MITTKPTVRSTTEASTSYKMMTSTRSVAKAAALLLMTVPAPSLVVEAFQVLPSQQQRTSRPTITHDRQHQYAQRRTSSTNLRWDQQQQQKHHNGAMFGMFGNIFGGVGSSSSASSTVEYKNDVVLADFLLETPLSSSASSNDAQSQEAEAANVQYASLVEYITNEWASLFVQGTIKLTTPVQVVAISGKDSTSDGRYDGDDDDMNVEEVGGVKFIFKRTKSNYKKWDDNAQNSGSSSSSDGVKQTPKQTSSQDLTIAEESKKKEKGEVSEGAVTVRVEKLSSSKSSTSEPGTIKLRVRAVRSDVDDDTIIKEMSEEKIVQELQEAVRVWKKQQKEQKPGQQQKTT